MRMSLNKNTELNKMMKFNLNIYIYYTDPRCRKEKQIECHIFNFI